jgi:hypothetical protein
MINEKKLTKNTSFIKTQKVMTGLQTFYTKFKNISISSEAKYKCLNHLFLF